MKPYLLSGLLLASLAGILAVAAPQKKSQPIETGTVSWLRDFDTALDQSKASGKPVFALFQEVPGCVGCQNFGRDVLSDELLVEAIESEFVPVVIYNNRPGRDAQLLKQFGEPSWNYQVIRFFDSSGKDIIPRKDRVWTLAPLAERMMQTLEKVERPVPGYLRAMASAGDGAQVEQAAFAMYCFWTGEMELGGIDGVIATEAGWFDGREVTLVNYRRDIIDFPTLVALAAEVKCANKVYATSDEQLKSLGETRLQTDRLTDTYRAARTSDQKKQISGTSLASLKLHPTQAAKINAWARRDSQKALEWLSPMQVAELR